MNRKRLYKRWQQALQWQPFTWNTLLLGLLAYVVFRVLYEKPGKENLLNARLPYILVMLRFLAFFMLILVGLSLLSTLISWLWLGYLSKKKTILHFHFSRQADKQYFEPELFRAIRPFLGFIKLRLIDDAFSMPQKFLLYAGRFPSGSIKRQSIYGKGPVQLPDIKAYHIQYGILFVEDMFHILSLPLKQEVRGRFFQPPSTTEENTQQQNPKKTEQTDIRIEQLRQVEGELLNYKDFESGDDVRRIVWKVFAKNRDLIVRVPERMEPYASHLYLYASFYDQLHTTGSAYSSEMLNYYKNQVWSVYRSLARQEWKIHYVADQLLGETAVEQQDEHIQHLIASSKWQQDKNLKAYLDTRKATVLIVHSLNDPKELANILEDEPQGLEIIFIRLSDTFRHNIALHWLRRFLFMPSPDRLSQLRSSWIISPLRRKILRNEKLLEKYLLSRD